MSFINHAYRAAERRWPFNQLGVPNVSVREAFIEGATWGRDDALRDPSDEEIEAAARVLDPDAWNLSDEDYFAEYDDGMRGVGHSLAGRTIRRTTSLQKAKEALTAFLDARRAE